PPFGTTGWPQWPPDGTTGGSNGEVHQGSVADYAAVAGNDPVPADGHDKGCPTRGNGPGCHSPTGACYNSECSNGAMVLGQWTSSPDGTTLTSRWSRTTLSSVTDGTSTTLLVGEKHQRPGEYGHNWIPPPGWPLDSPFENP